MVQAVLGVLGAMTLWFSAVFVKDFASHKGELEDNSWGITLGIGFIVNFFDTLGIGSFAPTTALLKFFKQTKDRIIPGTLNVGCTVPVVLEAFIFIAVIEVEIITLVSMLASATAGASLGTGEAIGLTGGKLIIAIVANFILGSLMTAGVGLYAPCMALVYMLGMTPRVAFPIMMGSCAFLMPVASVKFIKEAAYDRKASMAITIAGSVGVFIAAYLVKSMPINILTWLVIGVILYTSLTMLRSAAKNKNAEKTAA